jgi:hypothetical protein
MAGEKERLPARKGKEAGMYRPREGSRLGFPFFVSSRGRE